VQTGQDSINQGALQIIIPASMAGITRLRKTGIRQNSKGRITAQTVFLLFLFKLQYSCLTKHAKKNNQLKEIAYNQQKGHKKTVLTKVKTALLLVHWS